MTQSAAAPAVDTSEEAAPKPTKPASSGQVLGPNGYGKFKLGMTKKAALATGQLTETGTDGTGCTSYALAGGGKVAISDRLGVARIEGAKAARTPEGIRAGSIVAQIHATYPNATDFRAGFTTTVPGLSSAIYEFLTTDSRSDTKVEAIRITLTDYDCALGL